MNQPEAIQPTVLSHAENLLGSTIPNGNWTIVRKLPKPGSIGHEDLTGSFFSIGYIVERDARKGNKTITEQAFMKVIDVEKAFTMSGEQMTFMDRLKLITNSHSFECNVLNVCKQAKLDRIVQILGQGELPPPPGSMVPIPYILFEMADGDVRKIVSRANRLDDAWRFRVLHQVALGIDQLHRHRIAHQDLKPSNVLVFEKTGEGAKIGDMGRASIQGAGALHDDAAVAGAIVYAPPEQIFGIRPERWEDRREACDLYHLGTLATFLFAGVIPTNYYREKLDPEMRPPRWYGLGKVDYDTALPILNVKFTEFVDVVKNDIPEWAREELCQIIIHACHPDYKLRGDPTSRQAHGRRIGIETFVSRFDRLAKRAEIEVRR